MFFRGGTFDGGDSGSSSYHHQHSRFGGSKNRNKSKNIDNTKFYKTLEISKNASINEIKKAYKKLAVKHHPDKKGDEEKFKEISRAYEVLSDPEKRKIYDEYGEEGLEGGCTTSPTDIFDLFFGGGAKQRTGKRKGEDVVSNLKVTYEQIYNGCTRKLAINKEVICNECDGLGGPSDAIEMCNNCDGRGTKVVIRQLGNVIQQSQSTCSSCKGKGKIIADNKKCKKCNGSTTVKERKILEVYVEKGVPNRYKITISGEADQRVGEIPGDVVFVVEEQKHPVFTRNGSDLIMTKNITLYEALTGYKFKVTHLDERILLIQSNPGEITQPNAIKAVEGEGMPTHKNPFLKGDLLINFVVDFPLPAQLDSTSKEALAHIFPKPEPLDIDENDSNVEHVVARDIGERRPKENNSIPREAYEDDEGPEFAHQGVQCRQQ